MRWCKKKGERGQKMSVVVRPECANCNAQLSPGFIHAVERLSAAPGESPKPLCEGCLGLAPKDKRHPNISHIDNLDAYAHRTLIVYDGVLAPNEADKGFSFSYGNTYFVVSAEECTKWWSRLLRYFSIFGY